MTASKDFSHEYLEYLSSLIAQLDREPISKFADLLLTAFDGGYLKQNCDLNIHIPTKVGEYGPAEDLHMVVCGLVGSYFRKKFLNA